MNAARKPEIVCIGAQKAGTSWLHETLSARADVWVPPFKELHFFDHKFIDECRRWTPWHVRKGLKAARARHLARNDAVNEAYLTYLDKLEQRPLLNGTWYKFVFSQARPEQHCLDVTPEYSCLPDVGIDFFKRFLPDTKLIYIIRSPKDRLKSQLRMMAHRKGIVSPCADDWAAVTQMPALQTRGDYRTHVPRWDARFGADQLLYLPFDQIKSAPCEALRCIEIHCNLPPHLYERPNQKVHPSAPIQIPEGALAPFEAEIAAQNKFLRDRFGPDFLAGT